MSEPLWLHRPLLNSRDIYVWGVEESVRKMMLPEQLDVKLATVRQPVDWMRMISKSQIDEWPQPARAKRPVNRPRLVLVALTLISCVAFVATQIGLWRTGRDDLAPLALVSGGAKVAPSGRIWIDTDAACGATARTDPDDCLAILWLVSQRAEIAGISTSFGNAPGHVVQQRVAALAAQMASDGLPVPPVFEGFPEPIAPGSRQPPAVVALQAALEAGPLTISALGPLTNLAAALEGRSDLQRRVTRIVAIMGHRPGHLFHPTEGKGNSALFGHGPIFSDLNVSVDPDVVRAILAMPLPLTLIPYDAATATSITEADLDALNRRNGSHRWVADTARKWLAFWNDEVGLPGFYPFDWVAAAYLTNPNMFDCAVVNARMTREWTFWIRPRQSLVIDSHTSAEGGSAADVLYCPKTSERLHEILMKRTLGTHL